VMPYRAVDTPFAMILHVLDAELSLARPAESIQNETSLLSALRRLSSRERGPQTL
jgi:hypothetical protein